MNKAAAVSFRPGETAVGIISLIGLYVISRHSFPLFHMIAELYSIVIGFSLFMLTWNSRRIIDNNYLIFIGIAFFFIAGIDLIHTLAYKGMDVFTGYGTNLPTQLWIAARYLQSLSFLAAPFTIRRELRTGRTFAAYTLLTVLLLASIFGGFFPDCHVEGVGLTTFKIVSEYLISAIFLASLLVLLGKRAAFDRDVIVLLALSIATAIGAELAFTFYVGVFDFSNLVGHYLKIIAFYLIYKAIIETGLAKPYTLMFRNLKETEMELKRQTVLLEEANREMESFSYSVSHDLRAPLRAIDGYARMILKRQADGFDEETRRQFNLIQGNTRTMGQLIDDILAFSRLGRQTMVTEAIDMEGLVREVWEELRTINPDRRMTLKVDRLPPGSGDRALIKQVITNLLSNAIKFTNTRDVAIIEAGGDRKGNEIVYTIKDNGVGFDMQFADKLFAVFQRLHGKDEFEGTGVGLAIVQRIILRHGGRVWAEGEVDKGATFSFSLPVL